MIGNVKKKHAQCLTHSMQAQGQTWKREKSDERNEPKFSISRSRKKSVDKTA